MVGRQSGAFRRRSFDIRRKKTFLFLFFARNGKRTSRDALLFLTPRTVAFRSRREESPPRIAPNRESRFFAETVRGREARGAGSARDRASRDVGGCRRDERVISSRRASPLTTRRALSHPFRHRLLLTTTYHLHSPTRYHSHHHSSECQPLKVLPRTHQPPSCRVADR